MFLLLAVKSILVALATLVVLRMMKPRSAAERSTVIHLGLLALLVLPVMTITLPALSLPIPNTVSGNLTAPVSTMARVLLPQSLQTLAGDAGAPQSGASWLIGIMPHLYWLPTLVLLVFTVIALARLIALRTRADVVLDPVWLSALAHAQKRMNVKTGTALLASKHVDSPVSWGLMHPTILLDAPAAYDSSHAKAIVAHEMAHIVHLDWMKLILARIVTTLFWFNPLVWLLAREAHQLREEAADDMAIAAGIGGLEYAELLVSVTRLQNDRPAFGAHGMASAKSVLHRRVTRILAANLQRGASGKLWIAVCAITMLCLAGPLSLVSVAPSVAGPAVKSAVTMASSDMLSYSAPPLEPVGGVRASRAGAEHIETSRVSEQAETIDADALVEMRAAGVTSAYKRAMADAGFPDLTVDQLTGTHFSGITPEYAQAMRKVGMPANFDDLMSARQIGVEPDYITTMRGLGITGSFADFRTLWSLEITPDVVRNLKARGVVVNSPRQLLALHAVGGDREP